MPYSWCSTSCAYDSKPYGQVKLLAGDLLLVQCAAEKLHDICDDLDLVLVELSIEELPNRNKILAAVLTFASVVFMAASGLVPIVIAAIFGTLMMIIIKVITLPQRCARSIRKL